MRTRSWLHAVPVLAVTALLLGAPMALAQVQDLPPTVDELKAPRPWYFQVMQALGGLSALIVVALVVAYVVKARTFRLNQRRGGSK